MNDDEENFQYGKCWVCSDAADDQLVQECLKCTKLLCDHHSFSSCKQHNQDDKSTVHSCGAYFHDRKSSSLCLEHIKSKKEQLATDSGGNVSSKVIKTRLDAVLMGQTDVDFGPNMQIPITRSTALKVKLSLKDAVEKVRDITYFASLLANLHVLVLLEETGSVSHPLDQNFFVECFKLICNHEESNLERKKREKEDLNEQEMINREMKDSLKRTFTNHFTTIDCYQNFSKDNLNYEGLSNILAYSAQELVANLKTHLVLNYEKMHLKRFFLIMKSDNQSWNSSDIQKLSKHAFKLLTGAETQWPSSVEDSDEKVTYFK
jgi:hypothetical protein